MQDLLLHITTITPIWILSSKIFVFCSSWYLWRWNGSVISYWLIELVGKHLLVSLSVITLLVFVLVVNIQMISYCKLMMTQTSCQMSYFNIFYSILWHSCQSPVTHTQSLAQNTVTRQPQHRICQTWWIYQQSNCFTQ